MNAPRPAALLFLRSCVLAVACSGVAASVHADRVVSNLTATLRAGTKLVDISYDLAAPGFGSVPVTLEASSDGGATWTVPVASATGAVGGSVTPGTGKAIVWNAGVDWPLSYTTQMRFRVLVDNGTDSTPIEGFTLVFGGVYKMGYTYGDSSPDTQSINVRVSSYFLQSKETTKAQWDEVRTWAVNNGYTDLEVGGGKDSNHPVHSVSWWDAVKWCNARSEKEGLTPVYTVGGTVMRTGTTEPVANWSATGYRLPTEAEWEKAARGGVEGFRFPWGWGISHGRANYYANGYIYDSNGYTVSTFHPSYATGDQPYTSPVGSFGPNSFGLYEMSGNVSEWCWDWYGNSYAAMNRTTDPPGLGYGTERVIRGGSWGAGAVSARCAHRWKSSPESSFNTIGFRPVIPASSRIDSGSEIIDTRDAPTIDNTKAAEISTSQAIISGTLVSDGGGLITDFGIVYSLSDINIDPMIGGSGVMKMDAPVTTGPFSVSISGLLSGGNYHFKAFATNIKGTTYSDVATFTTISNNADLSDLVIDGFSLSPSFSGATTTYLATVQIADGSVRIRPSAAHVGASLFARVNGGGWVPLGSGALSLPLALESGGNLVEVRVNAQDGATEKTYILEVFRNNPRPDAMVGRSLAFLGGANTYTGPLAQQLPLLSIQARPVTAYAAVANRGNRPDRFAWRGNGDTRHFRVEYRDAAGALVSAAVRAGLYRTPERQPDDPSDWLRVIVTPERRLLVVSQRGRTVTLRKVHTVLLDASSVVDPSVRDGVSIRVETR